MSARQEQRVYRIGSQDALMGRALVDMDDDGSAWLMGELGITSATTGANHPARVRICEAYADGYFDARSAMGPQPAWTYQDAIAAGHACTGLPCECQSLPGAPQSAWGAR